MRDLKETLESFPPQCNKWGNNHKTLLREVIERTITAEELVAALREENDLLRDTIADSCCEIAALREGLEQIKATIEEHHPDGTLSQPRFSFAKELHDMASNAIAGIRGQ